VKVRRCVGDGIESVRWRMPVETSVGEVYDCLIGGTEVGS
jgi:hypothetical protein